MQICRCARCGDPTQLNRSYVFQGANYCGDCVENIRRELGGWSVERPVRAVDPSICAGCERDAVEGEWAQPNGYPICDICSTNREASALPWWLKNSIVTLAVLLVVALVHGRGYFKSVRDTYRAEKRLAHYQTSEAIALLEPVVDKNPECDRCVLDLGLAYLSVGRAADSWKLVKNHDFKSTDYSESVEDLHKKIEAEYDKVDSAGALLDESEKLEAAGNVAGARAKVAEARKIYPPWNVYPSYDKGLDRSEAWLTKDWDRFLELSERDSAANPKSPYVTAGLASALAAKFAATGNPNFKSKALSALAATKDQAQGDKDALAMYSEFSERLDHRLRTREIITKDEYDKRFRPELLKKEEAKK